ncbi:MAG: hypothetical protein ACRCW2_13635 [Cellulosilyticaceae bacterium]
MNQNQSAIFSGIAYSYITFIDEYLSVLKNPMYSSFEYLDEDVTSILNEMKTLFGTIPTLVGAESDFKEAYASQLVTYRSTLEGKYRLLLAYRRELEHLSTLRNLTHAAQATDLEDFGVHVEDADTVDFEQIAKDTATFVFVSPDKHDKQARAAAVLPHIPMRMTKDSFVDYVERSLLKISIEDTPESAELLLSVLRQRLDGHLYPAYGQSFQDIALSLEDIASITDIEVFFEEADLLNETIDFTINLLGNLYRMICSFGNLLIFDALTFEGLTDMHVSFYDLYCTMQNVLTKTEDTDIFLETLPERVTMIREELEKNYQKVAKQKNLDPLFMLIQTYLVMDLSYVFGFDAQPHDVYSAPVQKIFKEFLSELKEYLLGTPAEERKLRMQYFMSVLPFIMNQKTFENYVMHGFSSTGNPKRNLLTAVYLTNILDEGGYFELLDEAYAASEHHYHEDHEHGHDGCECDHDDPNHVCSCDHEDPDHHCNCNHSHK